jgi:hypothetical protein
MTRFCPLCESRIERMQGSELSYACGTTLTRGHRPVQSARCLANLHENADQATRDLMETPPA